MGGSASGLGGGGGALGCNVAEDEYGGSSAVCSPARWDVPEGGAQSLSIWGGEARVLSSWCGVPIQMLVLPG